MVCWDCPNWDVLPNNIIPSEIAQNKIVSTENFPAAIGWNTAMLDENDTLTR